MDYGKLSVCILREMVDSDCRLIVFAMLFKKWNRNDTRDIIGKNEKIYIDSTMSKKETRYGGMFHCSSGPAVHIIGRRDINYITKSSYSFGRLIREKVTNRWGKLIIRYFAEKVVITNLPIGGERSTAVIKYSRTDSKCNIRSHKKIHISDIFRWFGMKKLDSKGRPTRLMIHRDIDESGNDIFCFRIYLHLINV